MSAFSEPYPTNFIQDKDEYTTVFLRKRIGNTEHLFYCNHCQKPLFKYSGSVAMLVAGDSTNIMKAPFKIKCNGKMRATSFERKCPITYIVEGFVETLQN